jgi:hypothetical protein
MGAMTNNSRKLANFAGFYKGIQSAGGAIAWSLDGQHKILFMNMLTACWAILAGSLLIGLPLIWFKIRDSVPIEEDVKFSDETVSKMFGKDAIVSDVKHSNSFDGRVS